jgi:ABC-2 type transport system ATP-binding protein
MIYGLIGENGAGKSTFMRAVMGLIHSTSGELSLFGGHTRKELLDARRKIGQSIETPALYLDLTGKQNMQIQVAYGGVSERQIEDLLALVNLNSAEKKKVKNYSLGMKQRLAIAMALVTNPELLILDEPMNGLDPLGIVEIRELLKKLVTEKGLTVILSSHLLSELSEIATHYGIIHNCFIPRKW